MVNQEKVVIINTGGTIAMELDETTDSVQTGTGQPLRSVAPVLQRYAQYEMIDLFNVPSPHMTPDMMYQLSNTVHQHLNKEEVTGVVVTHGTDTLEETAYYLHLTIPSDKPVVFTGAMRSSNELGSDGPVNLIQAVRVAADPFSRRRGAMVVFNDEIHTASDVTKTHTSNVATFQSPAYGPIGVVTKKEVSFHQPPNRGNIYAVEKTLLERKGQPEVPVVKAITGMNPAWLQYLSTGQIDGVVLEAFGAGNVPPAIVSVFHTLVEQGVPVVLVSRCFNGYVQDVYGYEGGGRHLRDVGIILCPDVNAQKARIKLLVLLAAGFSNASVADEF